MKTERNSPCPCGSGKKYKHCCIDVKRVKSSGIAQPLQSEVDTLIPLFTTGQHDKLQAATREMIARYPRSGVLWKILGTSLHLQHKNAVAELSRAAELSPEDPEIYCNLGAAQQDAKQIEQAFVSYRQALTLRPDYPEALNNYGTLLRDEGHHLSAVQAFTRAIELQPNNADAHGNLGLALMALNNFELAIQHLERAVALRPDSATAHFNLGTAWHRKYYAEEAVIHFRRAIQLEPTFFHAHNSLGNALRELGQLKEATEHLKTANALSSESAEIHANLGAALQDQGFYDEAVAHYRQATALNPNHPDIRSGLLYCLSHCVGVDASGLYQEHVLYGESLATSFMCGSFKNTKDRDRRLNIGFVSGDFRHHALANFIQSFFSYLSKQPDICIHAYYNHHINDGTTKEIKEHFHNWNDVYNFTTENLFEKIQQDEIDILIDLSGHTALNRLPLFAQKPTPIQMSGMGYPGTTGLCSIDYYFTDKEYFPYEDFHWQFTEKLIYLPKCGTFTPNIICPIVNNLPTLKNSFFTFGSFNRANKINTEMIAVWATILKALPTAHFLIGGLGGPDEIEKISRLLGNEGIQKDRLSFHIRCAMFDYMELHHQVDLCLDTFPYNGGTTTHHALWMGVPTVTLSGLTPASRTGAQIMLHMGMPEFVAESVQDYIEKAIEWSRNLSILSELRPLLRGAAMNSFSDPNSHIASAFANALRICWYRWCDGEPAGFLDVSQASTGTSDSQNP